MQRNNGPRITALVLTLLFGLSCSSVNFKKIENQDSEICNGSIANKKYIFTLATYNKVPSGIPVGSADAYSKTQQAFNAFVSDNFIKVLFSMYFDPAVKDAKGRPTPTETKEILYGGASMFLGQGDAASNIFSGITWVGQNSFAACAGLSCSDIIYPSADLNTPVEFDSGGFIRFKYGYGTFTYGDAHGLLEYILDSGFNFGSFLSTHYFVVPERDQTKVCEAAGLNAECYHFKDRDAVVAFRNSLEQNPDLKTKFPFLRGSVFMKAAYQDVIDDSSTKLAWQSAFSKDLFTIASTKTTKALKENWIVHRLEWNPTLFCKYAKTSSDLYTH